MVYKMKISIAFLPEEAEAAQQFARIARSVLDVEKVRESARHAPFIHIYITTKKPENRYGSKGIT